MVEGMSSYVTYFIGIVEAVVFMAWFNGWFGPKFIVYAGDIMTLMISLVTSGYVAFKTVDNSVNFT